MNDKLKHTLAAALVAAGVAFFYLLNEQILLVRVLSFLAGLILAVAVFVKTEKGQQVLVFANEALAEVKKVAWPSRRETLQTTGIVFAFVVIMSVFLWVTDKSIEYVLYNLVLGWKK